jgi:hypothetical protein
VDDVERDNCADPRPWEQPGAVRRDRESPRGRFLLSLAWAAFISGVVAFVLSPLPALCFLTPSSPSSPADLSVGGAVLLGWVLCAAGSWALVGAVWRLVRADLALMRAGRKDPAGRAETADAGLVATFALVVPPAGLVVALLSLWACR